MILTHIFWRSLLSSQIACQIIFNPYLQFCFNNSRSQSGVVIMAEGSGLSPGQPPPTVRKSLRISLRKTAPTTSDDTPKRRRKTAAEVSRDYRERMEQNPDKYKLHRAYETNRVKVFMARLGEEDRKNYQKLTNDRVGRWRQKVTNDRVGRWRQKVTNDRVGRWRQKVTNDRVGRWRQKVTNDRVGRWRQKQKMLGKNVSTYTAPKTRKEKEQKRAAWKKQKALYRANMSEEAKKLQNERRRRKYQEKKAAMLYCDRRSAPSSNCNQPPVPPIPASSQETSPTADSTQEMAAEGS